MKTKAGIGASKMNVFVRTVKPVTGRRRIAGLYVRSINRSSKF